MSLNTIIDAHCHPTDTPEDLHFVPDLSLGKIIVMSTRPMDQEYVSELAEKYPEKVIPSFGIHPWFSYLIYDPNGLTQSDESTIKTEHYKKILSPEPPDDFIQALPQPTSLTELSETISRLLAKHPSALVGEIGLDKPFRLPVGPYDARSSLPQGPLSPHYVRMEHQIKVFESQLKLASKEQRTVSIHSVQTYTYIYDVLSKFWDGYWIPSKSQLKRYKPGEYESIREGQKKNYPPRICFHSYSGSGQQISLFSAHKVPSEFYYSFSIGINSRYKKMEDTIQSAPDDRILPESDHHSANSLDKLVGESVSAIAQAKTWSKEDTMSILSKNSSSFLS
ncbi:TatD DNase family Scn1 [Schizosaccharomyces cryophilus OY26]|uniref:TatD DNase family Scn1 n=1 Tax=Schizosaccharomyces cryophilus (strain OY26 / ATCC MYA-4695 / CBS 11777 / NBRC 106824 / NRRL Y48691) TaxID=653667 RepID=S9W0L8_SCHCR|nr:TatD DNase family Scn1 [Schizosaccharomyces cryophilus OY26]EPY53378.1 TatD DNase family Scn1 [Schizosaccharomyces cryophilus OY26]